MPILGIIASQGRVTNSYESIATVTVGAGGSSSISFTSIPSTYKHLQIRYSAIPTSTTSGHRVRLRFNSDTANNYATHILLGDGAVTNAIAATSTSQITAGSNIVNIGSLMAISGVIDVLDYALTTKNRTVRTLTGGDFNGNGEMDLTSGLWINTANAITSILLYFDSPNTVAQHSRFALYGIKD